MARLSDPSYPEVPNLDGVEWIPLIHNSGVAGGNAKISPTNAAAALAADPAAVAVLNARYVPQVAAPSVKFNNSALITFRNVANTADLQALTITNGDGLVLGNAAAGKDVFIVTGGGAGDVVIDTTAYGGTGVVSVMSAMRVGAIVGSAPTEKLEVLGNLCVTHLGGTTGGAFMRFVDSQTSAKSWQLGSGIVNAGRFEILDTSDSASPYLTIFPNGDMTLVATGKLRYANSFATGAVSAGSLAVGSGTDNGTTKWLVNTSGQPRWVDAANITTTVGAAGAAAALPATPAKYFTVLDAAGNPFKIPAYNP